MIVNIALVTVFLVGANCFYINQEFNRPRLLDLDDIYSEQPFEYVQPVHVRQHRQVHGEVNSPEFEKPNFEAGSAELALDNVKKVGAPLSVAHTPQRQNNDYFNIPKGGLTLFVDNPLPLPRYLGADTSKSMPPFISNRSWQPTF